MLEKNEIAKLIEQAPRTPGVYKMYDGEDKVIYIGKAKDLKKRLRQYFKPGYEHSSRTHKLLENLKRINFITVDTELESMILETNLIKQFRPKYNILMKDDKNYVYIKITKEDFPRIQIVRQVKKDGAKYIGPKTAQYKVKSTLKLLKKLFPFRHCGLDIELQQNNKVKVTRKVIKYPCLDYYIKRCAAPCINKCSKEEYAKIIKNVEDFLEGRAEETIKNLHQQMQDLAAEKKFEKAAKLRDKLQKVEGILEKQKVADPSQKSQDIINYLITQGKAYFNLFQVRGGKLLGQENFTLSAEDFDDEQDNPEVLEAFLKQYYELATDIPKEIIVPHIPTNKDNVQTSLGAKIKVPKLGKKEKLLKMSLKNARIFADRQKTSWQKESELTKEAAKKLQETLELKTTLKRIECYDISHLSGTETVGSMVVFINGAPKKDHYRKFKLRTVQNKPDDYKSMKEVLMRRFSKIAQEVQAKDYKFRKALKKHTDFIEKHNLVKIGEEKDKSFYILEKEKEPIGSIGIKERSAKVSELTNLWLKKDFRGKKLGYKLIKEAITKTKAKRVYIICNPELKEYYQLAGFEDLKKLPEELIEKKKECKKRYEEPLALVYDKLKHKKDKSFTQIPDLVVIDGGKGQLSCAIEVLKELNLEIPHISLAKRLEEIFTPKSPAPILLERNNEALKLLQRARDEAHRFAITYNRKLRSKKLTKK